MWVLHWIDNSGFEYGLVKRKIIMKNLNELLNKYC